MIDALQKHFSTPEILHRLDILSEAPRSKPRGWGFEGWFQIEVIVALHDAGYDVTTKGKRELDCDIVVNGLGVELKSYQSKHPNNGMAKAFTQHPRASSYLFIAQDDKRVEKMRKEIQFDERDLGNGWVLLSAKGTRFTDAQKVSRALS